VKVPYTFQILSFYTNGIAMRKLKESLTKLS